MLHWNDDDVEKFRKSISRFSLDIANDIGKLEEEVAIAIKSLEINEYGGEGFIIRRIDENTSKNLVLELTDHLERAKPTIDKDKEVFERGAQEEENESNKGKNLALELTDDDDDHGTKEEESTNSAKDTERFGKIASGLTEHVPLHLIQSIIESYEKELAKERRAQEEENKSNKRKKWTEAEDELLDQGMKEFGYKKWKEIAENYVTTKTRVQVRDRAVLLYEKTGEKKTNKRKQ